MSTTDAKKDFVVLVMFPALYNYVIQETFRRKDLPAEEIVEEGK